MALTATATSRVQEDIMKQLGIASSCLVFKGSFNRTNLFYEVKKKQSFDSSLQEIYEIITSRFANMTGIIYCLTKNDCNRVASELQKKGISIACYHGDLTPRDREHVHHQWSRDKIRVIAATTAFGMGINKQDVRFIIHHSIPKSVEDYYQESGRAGRDGLVAHCILYYAISDKPRALILLR